MKRALTELMLMTSIMTGGSDYGYMPRLRLGKSGTQRTYTNKNANIEYYTDEKGNIRKRKIGGK